MSVEKQFDQAVKNAAIPAGVIAFFMLLFAANWFAVSRGYSPFLYCWLRPVGEFFVGWLNIANLLVLIWFAVAVAQKKLGGILKAGVAVVLVMGSPVFVDTLLRLDGKCS